KVAFLEKVILDPRHYQRGIALADFRNDDTDREAALLAQGASHEVGTIVELPRGGAHTLLGGGRNRFGGGGTVNYQGNGGGGQSQVLRESLQADAALCRLGRGGTLSFRFRTGHRRATDFERSLSQDGGWSKVAATGWGKRLEGGAGL